MEIYSLNSLISSEIVSSGIMYQRYHAPLMRDIDNSQLDAYQKLDLKMSLVVHIRQFQEYLKDLSTQFRIGIDRIRKMLLIEFELESTNTDEQIKDILQTRKLLKQLAPRSAIESAANRSNIFAKLNQTDQQMVQDERSLNKIVTEEIHNFATRNATTSNLLLLQIDNSALTAEKKLDLKLKLVAHLRQCRESNESIEDVFQDGLNRIRSKMISASGPLTTTDSSTIDFDETLSSHIDSILERADDFVIGPQKRTRTDSVSSNDWIENSPQQPPKKRFNRK